MGWPVFSKTDTVMGQDIDNMLFHQGGQAYGRPHIIRKNQKSAAIGYKASMQCHAVKNCCHPELAHSEMNVALVIGTWLKAGFTVYKSFIGRSKVC